MKHGSLHPSPRVTTVQIAAFAAGLLGAIASAGGPEISWFTIDGGGGSSASGLFEIQGTIGQPDPGVMSGGVYTLTGGFWAGALIPRPCPGDINGDQAVTLSDLSTLLGNFGIASGATLAEGDLSGDERVDLVDLSMMLSNFGVICAG